MFRRLTATLAALFCIHGSSAANTATQPTPRLKHVWKNRDGETWIERHEAVKAQAAQGRAKLIFIGDSITHSWTTAGQGLKHWNRCFGQYHPINMGFGGDRTEHALWRIENGELEGIAPAVAVVLIGTNNWSSNTPEEIRDGVAAVCDAIHAKLPETRILLLALFPRSDIKLGRVPSEVTEAANALLPQIAQRDYVDFLDLRQALLEADGTLSAQVMPDGLHPSEEGYRRWAEALLPHARQGLGE